MRLARNLLLLLPLFATACGAALDATAQAPDAGLGYDDPIWEQTDDAKADSSATAVVRQIDWDSYVYVAKGADDATVQWAVRLQVKSALGSLLHKPKFSLRDRDARTNIDPKTFKRTPITLMSADGKTVVANLERVSYHYKDRALVPKTYKATSFGFVAFFGDYIARAEELRVACADDADVSPDSLWFDFNPSAPACAALQTAEATKVNTAAKAIKDPITQVSQADADRRFLTVRATLTLVTAVKVAYPELDKLWGFGTDRTKLVSYAFFGVDDDSNNPQDLGLIEYARLLRALRKGVPKLSVVETNPSAMLLDFTVDGQALTGVTYEDMLGWIADGKVWPAQVGTNATKRAALLEQARQKLVERWIVWQAPVTVAYKGVSATKTLEIHTYFGNEDGKPEWRDAARNRYLEAFWHADVFSYSGHSHFGHGPLEPTGYNGGNFPDRYQTLFFDSCVSYNYYDIDFLEMHPGGSRNLDVVVDGLPAPWPKSGEVSANYILGVAGIGGNRSWVDILKLMGTTNTPGAAPQDPYRAVTGEEDNAFDPAKGKVDVTL